MKKVVLGAALGLSAIFASCGLIPPIPVDDVLALDNVETAAVSLAGKNQLTTQAATGTLIADVTFDDIAALGSSPVVPSSLSIRLGARGITVANCPNAVGSTNFTASNIEVTLRNQGSAQGTIITFSNVTFTGSLANGFYTASTVSGGQITSIVLADVLNILKNPGNGKNTATVSLNLSAESDSLKGCSVKFRFAKASGEVKF